MKNYEDFISGLREDVQVPKEVWAQYANTLAHIEQLSGQRKEVYHMKGKANNKSRTIIKAAAVAGVLVTAAGIFSYANPVAAAKLPLIGHIFDQVEDDATYSGDYKNVTVLPDMETSGDTGTGKQTPGVYTATDQGITITASEVYSDGYSIYLTAKIESEAGGFSAIPAHHTRRFGETTSQSVSAMGNWNADNTSTDTALSNQAFEGKAVDDHTFIGMLKLDRETLSTNDGTLWLTLSELRYDSDAASDSEDIMPASCIPGTWKLTIPFSVDSAQCREISVDKTARGYGIKKVFVSPYQVIVFCDAPYTTLTPETYTREDFEAQWGGKNGEIAAAGETPVTYEDMLAKKFYDYFETAVYNQDGEALAMQYGGDEKCVFAVQDLDLQKLHIYLTDEAHSLDLMKAGNEQQAKERSILDAEIHL